MQCDRKIFTEDDQTYIHILEPFTKAIRTLLTAVIYKQKPYILGSAQQVIY